VHIYEHGNTNDVGLIALNANYQISWQVHIGIVHIILLVSNEDVLL